MKAVVLVALAACVPALPDTRVPTVELPPAFEAAAAGPSLATIDWATFFADDQLDRLIGDALAGNFDLQLAVQRIELARAGILEISGQRLPQLSLVAQASVPSQTSTELDVFAGLQASWEPDVWRRLGHAQGAARARLLASVEAHHFVTTNLVADVATAYYSLVALDESARVLAETIARQSQALDMMRAQKDAGRTNELAVQQFAAQVASARAIAEHVQSDTRDLELQIAILLGRAPAPIARDHEALARPVPALAAGLPSDLLRQRPDIREAELEVHAARLDLAAARAAFYPRLTISAGIGYEAFDPRFLLSTPASLAYSLAAGVIAPLVNRRGIEAAFRAANANQISAMVHYQSVVLRGFADAASALSRLQHAAAIVEQQQHRRDALADSVGAANELFLAGRASYLDVLVAQQQTLQGELDLITARRDQQIAKVQLYRAAGGGWNHLSRK